MTNKPKMYMLIGLPATGKTTWRSTMSLPVVSSDDILEVIAKSENITYNEAFRVYAGDATSNMMQNAQTLILANESFVWDQTNLTIKTRRGKLALIPDTYHKIAVVFLQPPADKSSEYVERLESRPGKNIPIHIIAGMRESYQPPTMEEGFNEFITIDSFGRDALDV